MDGDEDLIRKEPASDALVVLEYRLPPQVVLPRIELAREGDVERVKVFSGGGLDGLSTPAGASLVIPGSFILPVEGAGSARSS